MFAIFSTVNLFLPNAIENMKIILLERKHLNLRIKNNISGLFVIMS